MKKIEIFPLGANALTVNFGNEIDVRLSDKTVKFAEYFKQHSFPGFIETVPAYASATVFYDVFTVRKNFPEFQTAFDTVRLLTENAVENSGRIEIKNGKQIEIPVCFDDEFALDLSGLCREKKLSKEEFIEIFTSQIYRVYMLGFLPGFAYLGEIDERLAIGRKIKPRLKVPKGSVGVAGRQTGVYPLESPGGWQIIGKTDISFFTPKAESPTLLATGDSVKFYAASVQSSNFSLPAARSWRKNKL